LPRLPFPSRVKPIPNYKLGPLMGRCTWSTEHSSVISPRERSYTTINAGKNFDRTRAPLLCFLRRSHSRFIYFPNIVVFEVSTSPPPPLFHIQQAAIQSYGPWFQRPLFFFCQGLFSPLFLHCHNDSPPLSFFLRSSLWSGPQYFTADSLFPDFLSRNCHLFRLWSPSGVSPDTRGRPVTKGFLLSRNSFFAKFSSLRLNDLFSTD